MDASSVVKYRWFWPWQDEKEEQWLTEMANLGFHLVKPDLFGRYIFQRGEPRNDVYRLDFQGMAEKGKPDYLQIFKDAGWQYVGELGWWQYFRKTMPKGEIAELYTDNSSKVAKYRRVVGFLALMFVIFFSANFSAWHGSSSAMWFVRGVVIALSVFYTFMFIRLWMRMRELSKNL